MIVPLRGCSALCSTSNGSNERRKKHHHDLAFNLVTISRITCGFKPSSRVNPVLRSSFVPGVVSEEKKYTLNWSGEEDKSFKGCVGKEPKEMGLELGSNLTSRIKLQFLEERDGEILSKRIMHLSRDNKVRSALAMYASMEASEIHPNAHACNSLLSCLVRNGAVGDALRVFETMRKKEIATGHTYSLILKAVAGTKGYYSVINLFKTLEKEETTRKGFDAVVYNTMISVCGKAKNWVETERLWRELKQNTNGGTTVTYCLLVSTFVQSGQTELAVDAYNEMVQVGLEPGEDVMKAIVASCTKEGNWTVALNVLRKMLDCGFRPNAITYNAMLNCLGKAGEADLAFEIYDRMKLSGHVPDVYTWNALLTALYRSQQYADALRLFVNIKEESSPLNVHLYNTALMSCQRLGLWERSLQLLWQMESSGMSMITESYNHVIRACETARKPKVAWQVYRHMTQQKCKPDTFTYLSLTRACIWGSLWAEIEEMLENVPPNASLYNALIHGFCLRGKITSAKKLYTRMHYNGLAPDGKTRALMLQHLPDARTKKK